MNQLDAYMQSIPVEYLTHVRGTIYQIRDSAIVQDILNISTSQKDLPPKERWDFDASCIFPETYSLCT
jgi:hypothetical protein